VVVATDSKSQLTKAGRLSLLEDRDFFLRLSKTVTMRFPNDTFWCCWWLQCVREVHMGILDDIGGK
jgi:hypothetical protein